MVTQSSGSISSACRWSDSTHAHHQVRPRGDASYLSDQTGPAESLMLRPFQNPADRSKVVGSGADLFFFLFFGILSNPGRAGLSILILMLPTCYPRYLTVCTVHALRQEETTSSSSQPLLRHTQGTSRRSRIANECSAGASKTDTMDYTPVRDGYDRAGYS